MTQPAVLGARPEPIVPPGLTAAPGTPRARWLARHPAWPITALLAGIPLWWALGITDYMFMVLAVPMAARLYAWSAHGNRRIRVPPGFGLWLLFLVCVLVGAAALSVTAPGTLASPVANRIISFTVRGASYLAVTVLLVFAGNLTERELPVRRLAWLLGLVALYTAVGGVAGMIRPSFHFTSPLASIVPNRLVSGNLVLQAQLHPALSQIQSILGAPQGRPDAPFVYTNEWGNCLAILLPWLLVAWWLHGSRRQRLIAVVSMVIVIAPIIYSLNRGLWIGLVVAVAYLSIRLAARGQVAVLGAVLAALAIAAVVVAATPLQGIISQRLSSSGSIDRADRWLPPRCTTPWPPRSSATGIRGTRRAASSPSRWDGRPTARPAGAARSAGTASFGCCLSATGSSGRRCTSASSSTGSGVTGGTRPPTGWLACSCSCSRSSSCSPTMQ